jgi:hypothetical protein
MMLPKNLKLISRAIKWVFFSVYPYSPFNFNSYSSMGFFQSLK